MMVYNINKNSALQSQKAVAYFSSKQLKVSSYCLFIWLCTLTATFTEKNAHRQTVAVLYDLYVRRYTYVLYSFQMTTDTLLWDITLVDRLDITMINNTAPNTLGTLTLRVSYKQFATKIG